MITLETRQLSPKVEQWHRTCGFFECHGCKYCILSWWLQLHTPWCLRCLYHPIPIMICYDLIKPSGFNSWLLPPHFILIGCLSYFGPENTTRHHETHGRWYQGTPPLQERVLFGIPLPVPVIRQNRSECGHVLSFFVFVRIPWNRRLSKRTEF